MFQRYVLVATLGVMSAVLAACSNADSSTDPRTQPPLVRIGGHRGDQRRGELGTHVEHDHRDQGRGVRQAVHVPDIDRKMHGEEDPRGMGMFLIQALVDEVEYVSEKSGSYARLVIRLNPGGNE